MIDSNTPSVPALTRRDFLAAGVTLGAAVLVGPSILRAETAALAALAVVSAAWLPPEVATLGH